jgi:hypothetical protein
MRYEVTLKRKQELNAVQNQRQRRETVSANSPQEAKAKALEINGNARYFTVESVRNA